MIHDELRKEKRKRREGEKKLIKKYKIKIKKEGERGKGIERKEYLIFQEKPAQTNRVEYTAASTRVLGDDKKRGLGTLNAKGVRGR